MFFKSQKRAERRMKRDFPAQVMLGNFAKRDCKVVDISESGHEDDRGLGTLLPEGLEDLQPVGLHHPDVADHQIDGLAAMRQGAGPRDRLRAVGQGLDDLTPGSQDLREDLDHQLARRAIVVDDEDPGLASAAHVASIGCRAGLASPARWRGTARVKVDP